MLLKIRNITRILPIIDTNTTAETSTKNITLKTYGIGILSSWRPNEAVELFMMMWGSFDFFVAFGKYLQQFQLTRKRWTL